MSARAELFAAAVVALASVGCATDSGRADRAAGGDDTGASATSLAEVAVAEKFDFEATRPVALELSVSTTLVPEGESAGLELTREDGSVVYRGPVRAGSTFKAQLVVPSSEQTLHAVLRGDKALEQSATVSLTSGRGTHTFE